MNRPGRPAAFHLSIVVPVYNEEDVIGTFLEQIIPIVQSVTANFEIVFVNDGSRDRTYAIIEEVHQRDPRIRGLDLSRNFGKEAALSAGLDHAIGDAVIPIDVDLQDPPTLIPEMVERWRQGYDTVVAVREDRASDTWLKRTSANLFYRLMGRLSVVPIPPNAGDFRLLDRQVIEALQKLPERTRFMKGMFAWVGFSEYRIGYIRQPRALGTSKWRYWKLWNFALEGIFSFTTLPLRIWTYFGFLVSSLSFVYILFIIARTLIYGVDVPGYASLVVLLVFFSGINMVGLGILGEYVGRIFIETKRRPVYLVRRTTGAGYRAPPMDLATAAEHLSADA